MSPTSNTNEPALSNEQSERMRALAEGGDKDAERVLTLARAADRENAEAQFYLAHSLQEGALGLNRDPEGARKLFARAAAHGYREAQQEIDRQEKASTSSHSRKDAGVGVTLAPLATKQQELVRFDDAIIRLAVRAYLLSMPIFFKENDLIPLISANKAHFVEGGMVILYLQTAGSAMAQGALAFHGESSAQDMFGTSPEMQRTAGQVDAQLRSQGVALGQDFLWLAKVLPPAAVGDYRPFQARSQLSPLRQQMFAQVQMFRMKPQMAQPLVAQLQQMLPTWEQGIYDAVCRLDIGLPPEYAQETATSVVQAGNQPESTQETPLSQRGELIEKVRALVIDTEQSLAEPDRNEEGKRNANIIKVDAEFRELIAMELRDYLLHFSDELGVSPEKIKELNLRELLQLAESATVFGLKKAS